MADIKRVGVLGCGLMGSGIAQVAATAGYDTIVRDLSKEVLDRGRTGIEKSLAKFVEKGKLPAEGRDATLKRLSFTTTVADLKSVDIVIEAITEDLALKNALFKELDALCGQGTIFASNTSSLTIAELAGATKRADRFVGLHFFYGPADAARLRRPRHDAPHCGDHVPGVPGSALCAAALAQAHGAGGNAWQEKRQRVLRLLGQPTHRQQSRTLMLGYDAARWHAVLNDLPAALLLVAVLFDFAAATTKRESLMWAAIWTLWAGVIGGGAAAGAGEIASGSIEHGEAIHEIMEKHENVALITMSLFTVVLGWRLIRRLQMPAQELGLTRMLSVVGLG